MTYSTNFRLLNYALWALNGIMAIEILVIFFRKDFYFVFMLSVWIVCWIVCYIFAVKERNKKPIKINKKKFDNKK